jgi:UDP-glucuronate decarboxylase
MGEALCMTFYRKFNTPVKIVRPFNIYGPGMRQNDFRVIPKFISSALDGKPIPVHSDGDQTRSFCYITDAIKGFLLVLLEGKNGEVYNIGNDETEVSMNKLSRIIRNMTEANLNINNVSYPKNYPQDEPKRRCPDITKANQAFGFSPQVDLKTGLIRVMSWSKDNW